MKISFDVKAPHYQESIWISGSMAREHETNKTAFFVFKNSVFIGIYYVTIREDGCVYMQGKKDIITSPIAKSTNCMQQEDRYFAVRTESGSIYSFVSISSELIELA